METKAFPRLRYLAQHFDTLAGRPALFWLLLAFGVRLLAGVVLHLYSEANGFAGFVPLASGGDDRMYWSQAQALLAGIREEVIFSYSYVLAGLFALFGSSLVIGKLFSIVVGSLVVYVGVLIVLELVANRPNRSWELRHPANLAGVLLTFYPSAVFHSTQLMRDSLIVLLGILGIYFALRIMGGRKGVLPWLGYALALTLLYIFRPYAGFVLALSFILYSIFFRQKRATVLGSFFCALIVPWAAGLGLFAWQYVVPLLNPSALAIFREEVYAIGGSATGVTVDFSSFTGFLLTYPYSFLTAMFGPFLWQARTLVVATGLLESLPGLLLAPAWVQGIWRLLWRKESKAGFLLLFSLLLIGTIALFSANIGANVRLRLLPWSAFLIYAALRLGEKLPKGSKQENAVVLPKEISGR